MPPEDQGASGATGAAAGAPAGGAGAAVAAPPGPVRSATEIAADAARQRLAESGTILPKPEAGAGGEGEGAGEGAGEGEGEGAGAGEGEGAGEETAEEKAAREAEEADRAANPNETEEERTARLEAAAAAEAEHPEWTVKLEPLAEKGEEPLEIEAPDEETYNRLNRMQNEAAIGRQVRQERRVLERQTDLLESVEDQISMDPTGFITERVSEEVRPQVAMQLLFTPGVLEAVQDHLAKAGYEGGITGLLDNPEGLRTLRAELERDQLKLEKVMRQEADGRKAARANAQRIAAQIEKMIPDSIVGTQREKLYNETVSELSVRAKKLGIAKLDDEDVEYLVGVRLRQAGIRPTPPQSGKAGEQPGRAGASAATGPTADKLKADQAARRRAATAAPAGAGAPAARARPELAPTTEGRIAQARKFGLRRLLGRT